MCDVGLGETSSVFFAHLIGEDPRNLRLEQLDQILTQAAVFQPRPRIGLAYTEPLIHARILDLCRLIVERGFYCSITTNGFLLPRLADGLVEAGVDEITVSVDGPAAVHDQIRGKSGSFARLYEGVERLNAAKHRLSRAVPHVRFSCTITPDNVAALPELVEALVPLRPESISFSHLNFIDDAMAAAHNAHHGGELAVTRSNLGEFDLARIDVDALWAGLAAIKARRRGRETKLPPLQFAPDFADRATLARYYREPQWFVGGRRCTDPWAMLLLRTDGSVIPAHGRCFNYVLGRIDETPLAAIWNGPRAVAFRQQLLAAGGSLPACARCCGVIGKPPERGRRDRGV